MMKMLRCASNKRIRTALAVFGAAAFGLLPGCEGRAREFPGSNERSPKSGPAIAIVDLGGGVPEEETPNLLGVGAPKKSFDQLLQTFADLEKGKAEASEDAGVFVKFGSANIGAARSLEIGEKLEKIRQKKKVFCQADGLTNATIMAATRGCSKIYVSPAGEVATVGMAAQIVYMRRLLADELHLSIDFLQVGKYKGAEEPITRDGPSPEARASLMDVLSDMRASWLDTVTKARSAQGGLADALEDGPYSPARAKAIGLIDEVGYADEALMAVKAESGAVRERMAFGPGADDGAGDLGELVKLLAGDMEEFGPITLLRATGSIAMTSGGNGLFGGRGGIVEKDFDRIVRKLEADDEVKVVVLRLDSPGGSALASDLMWHHLMRLRKKKPLVVSVGDMAASGGMYLASAGDVIFAEPMSIVGSIGVVGGKVAVGDALERIGVHAETFPANAQKPGAATRAAYESPLLKWDDPTRARVLESMTAVYELFLSRVSEGRSTRGRTITRERVAESAEGKIFSGRQGKERGLVDEIGGLSEAIAKARELAQLPEDARIVVVGGKPTLLDALGPQGASEEQARRVVNAVVPSPIEMLERTLPELSPFVTSLAPLAEGERAVVAMPYALTVK